MQIAMSKKKLMGVLDNMFKDDDIVVLTADKNGTWAAPSKKQNFFKAGFAMSSIFLKEDKRKGMEALMMKGSSSFAVFKMDKKFYDKQVLDAVKEDKAIEVSH
jgi:hypothetical protein